MGRRPGCVTGLGMLAGALVLLGVAATAVLAGQVMFSPGDLNARAGARPLGGVRSHAELNRDCGACHATRWDPRTVPQLCVRCHADIASQMLGRAGLHGRLVTEAPRVECPVCHPEHGGPDGALTRIDEATFPHSATAFSLRSHRRNDSGKPFACADCHQQRLTDFDEAACIECHTRIDAAFMRGHVATWGRVCIPCHDGTGRNGVNFDHNKLRFKLEGAHAGLACERCHAGAASAQRLQQTPTECGSCHAKDDRHAGSFGTDCSACHSVVTWKGATFDHKAFPIDHGSQERRPTCKTCHPRSTTTYDCYGCHAHTPANVVAEHQGEVRGDLTDCVRCHKGGGSGD